ncbi:nickel pincer cofactor biosynthesis protein LarB [Alicyclobacillus sp. SO9]|uniref:nickel pincer cofactor biosynthesis protein LarB n=1 Tax=Alicyclobacillus sp. SO9 TaxID=2665646 RepID=UPI0018E74985|nr:nickel pincer cofactor biosynthesis protein LarB [Alicyclobacillus sp. SO9]QQE77870.1 nickel pincer cofactor biosynthesis protein LarB [Alicyclobacillus sp. SO9]
MSYRDILESVQSGTLSVDEGLEQLGKFGAEDLGFARIDHHRSLRKGFPEVVYCEGKTVEQSVQVLTRLVETTDGPVLGTRSDVEVYHEVSKTYPDFQYDEAARMVYLQRGLQAPVGNVLVLAAGTSDLPVAREAVLTLELMGAATTLIVDVGVAGLHRLMQHLDTIYAAKVIVVVAGMEGALASVVTGLVDKPVVAVPTSVGYGSHFNGLAPLLSMLNACASGVGTVNIDNGFGAGYLAALINRLGESE